MGIVSDHAELAQMLCRYARLCYERRLVGAAGGNLSLRLPGGAGFLTTATGVALRDVTPQNLVAVDNNGVAVEAPPGLRPSKELGIHIAVYQARPDTHAVIHVHSPYATTYAIAGRQIPSATVSADLKLRQAAIVPEAAPGSKELADLVARALGEGPPESTVVLLRRHGIVAIGSSLCDAFDAAELAEDTARIAFQVRQLTPVGLGMGFHIVDLTASVDEGIHCYPTDPRYARTWHAIIAQRGSNVSRLQMGAHTGTHVDAPLHFVANGAAITEMPLERFFGPAIAIDALKRPEENITVADFDGADIHAGDIVLFHTGWDERTHSPRFFEGEWPGFEPEAVQALLARGAKAIGGDVASADGPSAIAAGAPAHVLAMRAGLPIFEGLVNLSQVLGRRFTFIGLPLKLEGCEASPLRAIALFDPGSSDASS